MFLRFRGSFMPGTLRLTLAIQDYPQTSRMKYTDTQYAKQTCIRIRVRHVKTHLVLLAVFKSLFLKIAKGR